MKILISSYIKNFKGEDMLDEVTKKPVEARSIIATAMVAENNENKLTPEKKNQAFQIGIKLYAHDEIDLTIEQMAFIKERVGIFYGALVYGRISELFDGKKVEEKK